jgi:hypothetical protein
MTTMTESEQGAQAAQGFNANHIYRGTVTRQITNVDQKGVPFVALYVKLDGMLVDLRNPDSGYLPAPPAEVEVRLRFDENNTQHMEYSVEDLARLGFEDEDLSKLDPAHPEHVSFVGNTVHCAPAYKATNRGTMCFWNLRFPAAFKLESGGVDLIAASGAAEVFKRIMQAKRKDKDSLPADTPKKPGRKGKKEDIPF